MQENFSAQLKGILSPYGSLESVSLLTKVGKGPNPLGSLEVIGGEQVTQKSLVSFGPGFDD